MLLDVGGQSKLHDAIANGDRLVAVCAGEKLILSAFRAGSLSFQGNSHYQHVAVDAGGQLVRRCWHLAKTILILIRHCRILQNGVKGAGERRQLPQA